MLYSNPKPSPSPFAPPRVPVSVAIGLRWCEWGQSAVDGGGWIFGASRRQLSRLRLVPWGYTRRRQVINACNIRASPSEGLLHGGQDCDSHLESFPYYYRDWLRLNQTIENRWPLSHFFVAVSCHSCICSCSRCNALVSRVVPEPHTCRVGRYSTVSKVNDAAPLSHTTTPS